jgi:hypothetical protein
LDLSEYNSEGVILLMEYLYSASYKAPDIPPSFSLPLHTTVFQLAVTLAIPSLEAYSASQFRHALNTQVTNLDIYFASVVEIYNKTTSAHPGLRNAVVAAAIVEIKTILGEDAVRDRFHEVTVEFPEFQSEILTMMVEHPDRPIEVIIPELCAECGPVDQTQPYVFQAQCRGCGENKSLEFL